MKIQYLLLPDEIRVHKAGCADVKRDAKKQLAHRGEAEPFDLDAETRRAVIEDAYADFIFMNDESPWTDYEAYASFAPCVDALPRDREAS